LFIFEERIREESFEEVEEDLPIITTPEVRRSRRWMVWREVEGREVRRRGRRELWL